MRLLDTYINVHKTCKIQQYIMYQCWGYNDSNKNVVFVKFIEIYNFVIY
jgi:hypothetical protein